MRSYVYLHVDPRNGELRYVGRGTAGRAWSCGSSTAVPGKRGNRTKAHNAWINELLALGYTPGDFVYIHAKGLSSKEAAILETELVDAADRSLLFNAIQGLHVLKITQEKLSEAKKQMASGKSLNEAALAIGVAKMTLWRALNNKIKALRYGKHQ